MIALQMKQLPNHFEWGKLKTPLEFSCGPLEDFHPLGYEPEVINIFEHYAAAGDVVVDAGASIGLHTCLLSKLVGEEGIVIAFEPQLVSFNYLMHHVHVTNKLSNVLCIRQALWQENVSGLKLFNWKEELGYSTFTPYFEASSFEHVEGRTLDSLLVEEKDHPRILKIDCEGAEANVLLGAQRHLTRGIDCVILELNYKLLESTGRTDKPIRQFMHELGYDMFLINIGDTERKNELAPPIVVPIDKEIKIQGGFHINVLFSTKEKVRERWQWSRTNGI